MFDSMLPDVDVMSSSSEVEIAGGVAMSPGRDMMSSLSTVKVAGVDAQSLCDVSSE
jgi:hypothetical protein